MMPLSQVLAYNTDHLVDAAAHWQALADQREEVFAGVRNDALSLPLEGATADALHQRTSADYSTAMDSAGNLRQAAMIAKDGASTLDQMHSRVLYTLEDAQADGFTATEDLSVVDTRPSANPAQLAQRQAQAQAYAGQLKAQVTDLVTHDTQVGADMTNATAGEGKIMFTDFKQDGGQNGGQDGGDNTLKVPQRPNPPAVINMHAGESPPVDPGKHQCSGWDVTKYTGEGIGGPLIVTGSVLAGIAASPLGPGEWAAAIGGVLTGGATTIDGFEGLAGCE